MLIHVTSSFDLSQKSFSQGHVLIEQDLIYHTIVSPISIDGNNDFLAQALNHEWIGDGSTTNPIVIENYSISSPASEHMIHISNTDLNFIIQNNILNGVDGNGKIYGDGIWLNNVQNGQILNNTIFSNKMGISLEPNNKFNLISGNKIYNNTASAIHLYQSDYNIIKKNQIFENLKSGSDITMQGDGIELGSSHDNYILNNKIYLNPGSGVILRNSQNNNLSNNVIFFNKNGIKLQDNSRTNLIMNNSISNNSEIGIALRQSSYNNFSENTITNSSSYGMNLDQSCTYNKIFWNDFITNSQGTDSQCNDDSITNIWIYNYWSDLLVFDENLDLFVDHAYLIDGSAKNQDEFPLISSYKTYSTRITYPFLSEGNEKKTSGFFGWISLLVICGLIIINKSITKKRRR